MRLALAFGRPDVDQFLSEMTARQFEEWLEFWRWEPFGMEWMRSAQQCAVIAQAAGSKMTAQDFLPCLPPTPEQTGDQMQATLMAFFFSRA